MKPVFSSAMFVSAALVAMGSLRAEEPKGLPEAPGWLSDPANPNQPKPPELAKPQLAAPPLDPARDPDHVRAAVAKSANDLPKAKPTDRFAEAMKPQTHKLRPGQFAAAATGANNGDILLLAPGVYKECASVRGSNITIKAERPGTAIFDGVTCEGKAILVLKGNQTIIDGLVFRNATVQDRNGAGIRGEGLGLTVKRSTFTNNENGILYSVSTPGYVLIEDSVFDGNGTCEGSGCSHGIYINQVTQLTVRRSTFINTHIGHHLKSRAKSTLVEDCVIDDHSKGNSSYLIDVSNGGVLVVRGNLLIKGPRTDNSTAFISFGMEGVKQASPPPLIERNRFINRLPTATFLLVHPPGVPKAVFKGNTQSGKIAGAEIIYRG
jgi:Right handed beta helix region